MSKILLTIRSKGEGYTADVILHDDGHLSFVGDCDIDCDGSGGNPHHDPYFQPDTALRHESVALNAEEVPFIVVPPEIINAVQGVVLGCKASIGYKGRECPCVVGDIGPRNKLGEASPAAAEAVGIDGNPNTGGIDLPRVTFELWPGLAAEVNGVTYKLQPSS
jgi:hypothetical protein